METVTEQEVDMMIEMADRDKKGGVDLEDFVELMKQLGLIPDKDKKGLDDEANLIDDANIVVINNPLEI